MIFQFIISNISSAGFFAAGLKDKCICIGR